MSSVPSPLRAPTVPSTIVCLISLQELASIISLELAASCHTACSHRVREETLVIAKQCEETLLEELSFPVCSLLRTESFEECSPVASGVLWRFP